MNLYFQFLTQNQAAAAVDLVLLPELLIVKPTIEGKVKLASRGQVANFLFKQPTALAAKLADIKFNEAEIHYQMDHARLGKLQASVKSLNGLLAPSATNEMWCRSQDFEVHNRDSMNRQQNANTQEMYISRLAIDQKPSILELAMELETIELPCTILDEVGVLLMNGLTSKYEHLEVFGCCDVGGKEMIVRLESNMLMLDKIRVFANVLPTEYPKLGKKLDGLHPLMFGKQDLCVELAEALHGRAKLICGTAALKSAAVRLEPNIDMRMLKNDIKHLLVETI